MSNRNYDDGISEPHHEVVSAERKPFMPLLPVARIIAGEPLSREERAAGRTYASKRDFEKARKSGTLQIPALYDLRGESDDYFPCQHDPNLQLLIEAVLNNLDLLSETVRAKATALMDRIESGKPYSAEQLSKLNVEVRRFISTYYKQRNNKQHSVAAALEAFHQAFLLNPYLGSIPTNDLNQFYRDDELLVSNFVMPPEGIKVVIDPVASWFEGAFANLDWSQTLENFGYHVDGILNEYPTFSKEDILGLARPQVVREKAKGAREIDVTGDYSGLTAPRLLGLILSTIDFIGRPDHPFNDNEKRAKKLERTESMCKTTLFDKLQGSREKAGGLVSNLARLEDIVHQPAEMITIPAIRAVMTGFSPESVDFGNWLIVKDGKLQFLSNALEESLALAQSTGATKRVELAQKMLNITKKWHNACLEAQGQSEVTTQALTASLSEAYSPYRLTNGQTFEPVLPTDTYMQIDSWIEAGYAFPPTNPEEAIIILTQAFGFDPKILDKDAMDKTIKNEDLTAIFRKAIVALMPTHEGAITFQPKNMGTVSQPFIEKYSGSSGLARLISDFTTTWRLAMPRIKALAGIE